MRVCVPTTNHITAQVTAKQVSRKQSSGVGSNTARHICCGDLLQGQVKKLEPLLAALAAVPWIDPDAEDGHRVPFIKTTVLDEVEGMGRPHQCIFTCTAMG